MSVTVVKRPKELPEDRKALSPPVIQQPLYQCATAVTLESFVAGATLELSVDGSLTSAAGGYPMPQGQTLPLPAPLVAGQAVKARQIAGGVASAWSATVTVADHTKDYPAGPPRPQVNPAPVHQCGVRTGVGNLLPGARVWITADGATVGDVDGCAAQQGVNVAPAYGPVQRVLAWSSLCKDPSPPSVEHITQPPPSPLPAPSVDPVYAGGQSLVVRNIVNGARVSITRNGAPIGTWPCWGGSITINGLAVFAGGETFSATQQMCPGHPDSPPGGGSVQPCGSLPPPQVGPVQAGDRAIVVTQSQPDALIKVWVNGVHAGTSGPPQVQLNTTVRAGDVVLVVQDVQGCRGQLALQIVVPCVNPPVRANPAWLDLFPVGHLEYAAGPVKGSVYYPATADGKEPPFHPRLAELGRVPIVFMAHGNHDPADPSYLGYDYFQSDLAKMGIVAVSIDCNALNGYGGGVQNIVDRADLIIDHIRHFQGLDADPASVFHRRLDFDRTGLMGHSRGGDAVVMVGTQLNLPGVRLRSVLALAPTNFRYWAGQSTLAPKGHAFMTLLPAGDGDVRDNNGAQFYDVAEPGPFKSQLYVHHTNHNFFNRRWLDDDSLWTPPQPAVSSRAEHERVLSAYGCALYRSTLLGHATDAYLAGTALPAGVATQNVARAFARDKATTVDHFDDGNTIASNSLAQPNSQTGGIQADEYRFDRPGTGPTFNDSFYGLTTGMVVSPRRRGGTWRAQLRRPMDLRRREVWIRCAEVTDGQGVAAEPTGFKLGLEDEQGVTAWVDSDDVGGVPRPYPRNPGMIKTLLSTLRFRGGCFQARERFDARRIVAILVRCDRKEPRPIAFDDLQVY